MFKKILKNLLEEFLPENLSEASLGISSRILHLTLLTALLTTRALRERFQWTVALTISTTPTDVFYSLLSLC